MKEGMQDDNMNRKCRQEKGNRKGIKKKKKPINFSIVIIV